MLRERFALIEPVFEPGKDFVRCMKRCLTIYVARFITLAMILRS